MSPSFSVEFFVGCKRIVGSMWTVQESSTRKRHYAWFKCDCGKVFSKRTCNRGTSCGCFRRKNSREMRLTHRMAKTPEYNSWAGMKQRCLNPRSTSYPNYGGRGITICTEWVDSFEAFYRDMGPRPDGHSLDRIDVNDGYYPENCRWLVKERQANNCRDTGWLTYGSSTQTVRDWARELGIPAGAIWGRISLGWPVERILNEPVRKRRSKNLLHQSSD